MTFHTNAIFEGGVLRPLTPLDLKEHEVVALSISTPTASAADPLQNELTKQRAILANYMAKVESRADDSPQDGLSNRDHDALIYGK